jgi:polysaccharide biosynthesis protein PslG
VRLPAPIGCLRAPLAALLATLALCLGLAASAAAETPLRGAHVHSLWSNTSVAELHRELDLLAGAGANAVRVDLSWSTLQLEGEGDYDMAYARKMDTFVAAAKERGLRPIVVFWSSPCWASSAPASLKQGCEGEWWERRVDRHAPSDPRHYAEAAAWVANRWGQDMAAIEIWNEPNLVPGAGDQTLAAPEYGGDQARAYADLLKASYPRIKAAAPGLPVLGGAIASSDGQFLERLYELGVQGSFDALALHAYNEARDPDDRWKPEWRRYTFITGVPWIREIMKRNGDAEKKLWLTEFGFSTCGPEARACVSPEQQAQYLADSFRIAAGWDFVEAALAYGLRDKGTDPSDREAHYGLVRRDFSLKPGYQGFKRAMGGAPRPDDPAEAPVLTVVGPTGVTAVPVVCPPGAHTTCEGVVTLTANVPAVRRKQRKVRLGVRRFEIREGQRRMVRIRVKRSQRALVRRRPVRAVVIVKRPRSRANAPKARVPRRNLLLAARHAAKRPHQRAARR